MAWLGAQEVFSPSCLDPRLFVAAGMMTKNMVAGAGFGQLCHSLYEQDQALALNAANSIRDAGSRAHAWRLGERSWSDSQPACGHGWQALRRRCWPVVFLGRRGRRLRVDRPITGQVPLSTTTSVKYRYLVLLAWPRCAFHAWGGNL